MTSMRLADGMGRTGAVFGTGSAPMVAFSAVDFSLSGYARPAGERTRVEYRRHVPGDGSQAPWSSLTAVEVGDDLQDVGAPDGVLYRVDLTEVAMTLSGAVDLRVIVEDPSGNTMMYALEPALIIDGDGRRRAVTRR